MRTRIVAPRHGNGIDSKAEKEKWIARRITANAGYALLPGDETLALR